LPRKILLADDSVTAQNMGKKILTDAGYEVTTVSNGSAALKKVQDNPPDLIVLDVYMPGHSGLEVCRRLKESANTAHIPILLTVGKLEPFKPDEARKARAEAFVVKPFEASELIAMVKRLETEPPKPPETKPSRKKRKLAEIFAASAIVETPDPNVAEIQEEGWRERLSVPHPHAEEKEEAPEAAWGTGFRDLSSSEAESNSRRDSAFTAEPFVASSLPPTPQDATPEEIAALQAAAALLSGRDPAAANTPSVETVVPKELEKAPAATDASPSPSVQTDGEQDGEKKDVTVAEAKPASESPVVEAAKQEEPAALAASPQFAAQEPGVIDQSEEPLFAPEFQPKVEVAAPAPQEEAKKEQEEAKKEEEEKAEEVAADPVTAAPVAEAATETPAAVEQGKPATEETEKKGEAAPAEAVAQVVEQPIPVLAVVPEEPNPAIAAATAAEVPVAAIAAEAPAETTVVAVESSAEPPAAASKETEPVKEIEHQVAAQPVAVAEAETKLAESAHWTAVSVALLGEEAAVALEREMAEFRTVAAAGEGSAHPVVESAIAVIEAPPAASEQIISSHVVEASQSSVQDFAVVAEATQLVAAIAEPARAAAVAAGAETSPEASVAAAPVSEKPASDAEIDASTSADMQAAWANWREIRESIVGSSVSQNVVDLVSSVAEPAEAAPEKESESTQTTGDPAAIANIVDSVLAELKPKIVEEIAKKLKKKK